MIEHTEGFKIIAIQPLESCAGKHLKLLTAGKRYYFCNQYLVTSTAPDQEVISQLRSLPPDIYSFGKISVNINAIAGKNGSGKSTLVELFYVMFYNIGKMLNIIRKDKDTGLPYQMEENINVALYFCDKGRFYKLRVKAREIKIFKFNISGEGFETETLVNNKKQFEDFFYNIVVNYSLYALNSTDQLWLKALFHKNDAYQTPIVLNPFRQDGTININKENYLAHSRLLANIVTGATQTLRFGKARKKPVKFIFEVDYSKFDVSKRKNKITTARVNNWGHRVFPELFEVFFGMRDFVPEESLLNTYAKEYILKKLYDIEANYPHYQKYKNFYGSKSKAKLVRYLKGLKADKSHISFKLKQALNFLRLDLLPKDAESFEVQVADFHFAVQGEKIAKLNIPSIELIPPSFLKVDISFSGEGETFNSLSSGEKQKIFSLSSLIYHLKNLDSIMIPPDKNNIGQLKLTRYKNVNIIFDEIELYYHPDLQRRFINDMIETVSGAGLELIECLNFIFITHSPFILSDIPKDNIMYLEMNNDEITQIETASETFGGNIHNLLADSFFLEKEGYMGEYAKERIKEVINFLNEKIANSETTHKKWNDTSIRRLIDMTGEPLVRTSLNELFSMAYLTSVSDIDIEIERLKKEREKKVAKK